MLGQRVKVYACKYPTDMRSSYDSLAQKVKKVLKKDPWSGHLFLFVNKRKTSCKCLYYDGTGFIILAKRLDQGTFSALNPHYKKELAFTQAEFSLFLEGAQLNKRFIESPPKRKKTSFRYLK